MSGTLNKVMLIGHLGDDIKMHYFEGGNCIGRFPLATNESYTNRQTGERVTNTEWHNVVVRNKAAEVCEKYLSKGDRIYVEGRLKTRQWQGDDGNMRYATEVHAIDFTFLNTRKETEAAKPAAAPAQQHNPKQENSPKTEKESPVAAPEDDDLPF